MKLARIAAVVATSFVVAACSSGGGSGSEETGSNSSAIISGTTSPASQNSVVLIVYPVSANEQVNCSGTLLAPNLVLTARHCVSNTSDEGFSCDKNGNGTAGGDIQSDVDPSQLYIFTGTTRPTSFKSAAAVGKKLFHDSATNLCNHDLALILLDKAVADADIAPIRLSAGPTVSESVVAVGWGVTETEVTPTHRQERTISVERVGPDRDDANQLDVPPNEFEVGESICQGDSGGPTFDASTNAVVGVVSRGGNNTTPSTDDPAASCTNASNFYEEPYKFKDTILDAFAAAGQSPYYENGPEPTTCATVNGATLCSYDCSSSACPSGYSCDSSDGGLAICVADPTSSDTSSGSSGGGCAVASSDHGARDGSLAGTSLLIVGAAVLARRRRRS